MLLNTKISQLIIRHQPIIIPIVSEHVLHHVVHLVLVLLQQVHQCITYLLIVELFISVLVEF